MIREKWFIGVVVLLIIAALAIPVALAQGTPDTQTQAKRPQLTEPQREEVKEIHEKIRGLKEQLIEKYKEFGVIDSEQAEKIKEHMENRRAKMEEKGFEPWMGMGRGKTNRMRQGGKGMGGFRMRGDSCPAQENSEL